MAATRAERGTIQGWHVLAGMIVFFGIIFAVNGVFLVSALNTHTGIVSQQPYRKGLDYNQRIAADVRQQQRGWVDQVTLDGEQGDVRLVLADKAGQPVTGLVVAGFLGRPSTQQYDVPVTLEETATAGTYAAQVGGLAPGNWLVQLEARAAGGDDVAYRLRKRLWLKP